MKRIVPIYIIREMIPPFLITNLVFIFILLMAKVLELTELVVVKGVKPGVILHLLALSLPYFMSLTVPMATLLAVLLAFLRLSGDNEITVLKSAGVSLFQLLPPVLLFCLWTYLLTSYLCLTLVPAANQSFRNELLHLAKARADLGIKEHVFNTVFDNMVLFVNRIPLGSDMMEDLFIKDDRDPEVSVVIVAARGRIATDANRRALILQLFDGVIDRMNQDQDSTATIAFGRYELRLSLGDSEKGGGMNRDQYEMPLDELWVKAQDFRDEGRREKAAAFLIEAHKRLSLPFACLVLGLMAVPLGIRFQNRGRNWGVTLGLIVFLVYYLLLSMARGFGEMGWYPPGLGMWMPNIVIGLAAVFLIRQTNREAPIEFPGFMRKWWARPGKRQDRESE